jgi:hypothetical protein
MPKNPEIPLHLYQVLEEEFISLYGPIPPGNADGPSANDQTLVVEFIDRDTGVARRVEAARDWWFRGGHVKDPVGLASEILQFSDGDDAGRAAAVAGRAQDEWARRNLMEYLRAEIEHKALLDLVEWGERKSEKRGEAEGAAGGREEAELPDEGLVRPLQDALNRLLKDSELYDSDRFSDEWLSTATKGLAAQRADAGGFYGDALQHFNRLLLEEAFPDYIERMSNIRLAAIYRRLHAIGPKALSLSGGGIRSGTFALGLLEGFARHDLLREFDYLSTVSGGGYVGSWLTAWLHRHPEGLDGVTRDLSNRDPVSKIDPDPKPIQYLREYSNFLTPKVGLLTVDTWTFIGIYLRNLLINWLVFIPLLMAALMIPRLVVTLTLLQPVGEMPQTVASVVAGKGGPAMSDDQLIKKVEGLKDVPRDAWVQYQPAPLAKFPGINIYYRDILLLVGFLFGVWALGYVVFNRPGVRETLLERSRFWRKRTSQKNFTTDFVLWCLVPLLVSAVCLTTYWAWAREAQAAPRGLTGFIVFGLAFTLTGWLIGSAVLRRIFHWSEIDWFELLGLVVAGLVGGLIFWVLSLSVQSLGNPIIGYGILVNEQLGSPDNLWKVANGPFPWNDWTLSWSKWRTELYVCLGVPVFLLTFLAGATVFVGLTSASRRVEDEDREWWSRFGAWVGIAVLAWAVSNALVIFGPLALLSFPKLLAAVGGLSGLISVLVGKSSLTHARPKAADEKGGKKGAAVDWLGTVLPILGLVFLAAFVALLSLATTGITRKIALVAHNHREGIESVRGIGGRRFDVGVLTNIPDAPQKTGPSPLPSPAPNRGLDEYAEYITPYVTQPTPTPAPSPGATPCTALCPNPAELAAQQKEEEEKKPDAFDGARVVHMNVLHHTSIWFTLALAVALFASGMIQARVIDLNLFSLHAGYRNRLIRAFLGASRPPGSRRPNPFTGFDPADDLHMHELRPAALDEGDILKQRKLAEALLDRKNPLSNYLLENGKLKNVEAETQAGVSPSPGLVTALRTDLNDVLNDEKLYTLSLAEEFLRSKRAERIQNNIKLALGVTSLETTPMRSDYHILLNRLVLEGAYPRLLAPCAFPPPPYKLLHVTNTTLNLVGGDKLAWQQRKAEPFSVSPLHSGCFRLGYRPSRDYGGRDRGGITIGTAATISGAAASSNMGYYTTSPVISLLLTLFNVRLGWWLGNPGPAGDETYTLTAPKYSFAPVLAEAFGLTNDSSEYVYLTDGGHFENLGLYEMVLRRSRVIVVSDAAADEEYNFTDLANAVRKVRIDLGVPIEFPCLDIYSKETAEEKGPGMYWAIGRVRYSCVDRVKAGDGTFGLAPDSLTPDEGFVPASDGVLLYIKPAVYGDEPRDVVEYEESHPSFPHQTTADQFFDEPQFESYRALASFITDELCGEGFDRLPMREVIARARDRMQEQCEKSKENKKSKEGQDFKDLLKWLARWLGEPEDGQSPDATGARAGAGGGGGSRLEVNDEEVMHEEGVHGEEKEPPEDS